MTLKLAANRQSGPKRQRAGPGREFLLSCSSTVSNNGKILYRTPHIWVG